VLQGTLDIMVLQTLAALGPSHSYAMAARIEQVSGGEGAFDREDRRKAMRFAFRDAGVDCVMLGYKNPAEIDEAIENLNLALAS
jgi:hypothetical protein